jgi:hypothetical protein
MRGNQEPGVARLVVTGFAAALLEVLVAGALVVAAAFVVDLPTWAPVLLVGGGIAATFAAFATTGGGSTIPP